MAQTSKRYGFLLSMMWLSYLKNQSKHCSIGKLAVWLIIHPASMRVRNRWFLVSNFLLHIPQLESFTSRPLSNNLSDQYFHIDNQPNCYFYFVNSECCHILLKSTDDIPPFASKLYIEWTMNRPLAFHRHSIESLLPEISWTDWIALLSCIKSL